MSDLAQKALRLSGQNLDTLKTRHLDDRPAEWDTVEGMKRLNEAIDRDYSVVTRIVNQVLSSSL